jgi:hypothetical protein
VRGKCILSSNSTAGSRKYASKMESSSVITTPAA